MHNWLKEQLVCVDAEAFQGGRHAKMLTAVKTEMFLVLETLVPRN